MNKKHVVITQTFYEPGMKEKVLDITKASFPLFLKQKGLIRIQTHNCQGDTHTMSIMEWESKADSDACMMSPDFESMNSEWRSLLTRGKINFKVMNYDVIESSQEGAGS